MAIASFNPDITPTADPNDTLPPAQSSNYMGLTYDQNQTPIASLLPYVEGAAWGIDEYYRQILGRDNDVKPIDFALAGAYQAYERFLSMELRVQNDLQGNTNQETQFTKVTGTALVTGLIPNVHDYFTATVGHLRSALFRVAAVNRQTWRREAVHLIEYQMVDYVDRVQNEMDNLKRKTTGEYVYSRERVMEGLAPTLKTSDFNMLSELKAERQRMGEYYLGAFSWATTGTLNLPGQQGQRIYDSYLIDFVMATFGYLDFPRLYRLTQLPKSGDVYLEQPQFWTAILKRDRNAIKWGNQQMRMTATKGFEGTTYIKSFFSSRMDYVIYPMRPDTSVNSGEDLAPRPSFIVPIRQTANANGECVSDKDKTYVLDGVPIPAYHRVSLNGYYVLTEAFYKNDPANMSLIEILTRDYLESKPLNLEQLKLLVSLYPGMERMEQFYFGPLLMCFMRYVDMIATT